MHINLTLAYETSYVSIARLTAAGIASRVGFNYEQVDNIKICVGEICNVLINNFAGADGNFYISFETNYDGITVICTTDSQDVSDAFSCENGDMAQSILISLTDRILYTNDGYGIGFEKKYIFDDSTVPDDILFANYDRNSNPENRNFIVQKYNYLAKHLAKRFKSSSIEVEDLAQVASIALIKAVERFDTSKGIKFVTFATPTIIGEIRRYLRDKGSLIKMPRSLSEPYTKVITAKEHLFQKLNRAPTILEISSYLNWEEEYVQQIEEAHRCKYVHQLDINTHEEDKISQGSYVGSEDEVFEDVINHEFITQCLQHFNTKEQSFINMRYYKGKSQSEISSKLGVSQMYVSRMEKRVLARFRNLIAD